MQPPALGSKCDFQIESNCWRRSNNDPRLTSTTCDTKIFTFYDYCIKYDGLKFNFYAIAGSKMQKQCK